MRYIIDDGDPVKKAIDDIHLELAKEYNIDPYPNDWWPAQDLPDIFNNRNIIKSNTPVGIEIGVDRGKTSAYLLEKIPNLFLYGVDPYQPYQDYFAKIDFTDQMFAITTRSLAKYANRFHLHRMTSDEAASKFEDESMDFIFIDGGHTEEQVLKDCLNYYPKLKKGGLFCGHDYHAIPTVAAGVNRFCKSLGLTEIQGGRQDMWYFWKPTFVPQSIQGM